MKDQDYNRYSFNINGDVQATKWLRAGVGINFNHSIQNYGIVSNSGNTAKKDSYGLATSLEPYAPAYDQNANIIIADDGPSQHNIVRNIDQAKNETRVFSVMANTFAEATILPWLKWRTNFGMQYRNNRVGSFYGENFSNPLGSGSTATAPGVAYNRHLQRLSWTLENLIFVNKTFADVHTVGVTLLQSSEYYRLEDLNVRAFESVFPTALWYNVGGSNTSRLSAGSSFDEQKRASYMARVNYSLMDKYLLTVTGRWDGASMLAAGNKWDFFPSTALAWKIDQEQFMEEIDWLSALKLRVGYGVTGNAAVKSYVTSGSITSSAANIPFGIGGGSDNTTGAKANVLPNRNLSWEKTASTNLGVDFGFFNNRINGSVEYNIAKTSDLLLDRSLSSMTGYTTILANIGKTQNKGVEITLSTTNIKTKNFTWRTDFTFSRNKEKIVELASGKEDDTNNGWFIGKPTDEIWDYKYDRLWQDTEQDQLMMAIYKTKGFNFIPGQAKIVDQDFVQVDANTPGATSATLDDGRVIYYMDNGFGVLNSEDYHFQGSFRPKWVDGVSTVFTYKNWELNSFIFTRMGNTYYGLMQTYGRRQEKDIWSETNTSGKYPQPRSGGVSYDDYSYRGLNKAHGTYVPASKKWDDPNRYALSGSETTRDAIIFRLSETYLIRAEAYGRKGNYGAAVDDINVVRKRVAYKPGENREEVLARLYPGNEQLTDRERSWLYTAEQDMTGKMLVDQSYWDGTSANSKTENYPPDAQTTEDRFVNFILNEVGRELNQEMIYYAYLHHSGWQASRVEYRNQTSSGEKGLWDVADNQESGTGPNGEGMGYFQNFHTLKPFAQGVIDMLTDKDGVLLDASARKAYQNYGY